MDFNFKYGFLAALTILATVSGSAVQVENQSSMDLQLEPGEEREFYFDLGLTENESEVTVEPPQNTENYNVYSTQGTSFSSNGTYSALIIAGGEGGVSESLSFQFNSDASGQSKVETLQVSTKIPWTSISSGSTWINNSYTLEMNSTSYPVDLISDTTMFLNQSDGNNTVKEHSIDEGNSKMFGDVNLTVVETTPFGSAKINAFSKTPSDTSFSTSYNVSSDDQSTACQLGISTEGGTTLDRGRLFVFKTVNKNSGDSIGGVSYQLVKTVGGGEIIAEGTTSQTFASAQVSIPEQLYKDNPEIQQVLLKLTKPESNCDSSSRTIQLNTPYGDYIKDNKEFQLGISVDNKTTYGNITGSVETKAGDSVESGRIRVKLPDGSRTEKKFSNSTFSYSPENNGTYTVEARKTNYVSSKKVKVDFIADKDGDGVINSADACPDTEGVPENDGCPEKEVDVTITEASSGERVGIASTGTDYDVQLLDSEGNRIDYTGNINITKNGEQIGVVEVQDGEIVADGEPRTVSFDDAATYTLSFDAAGYEKVEHSVTVEKPSILPENLNIGAILGVVILFILLAVGYTYYKEGSAGGTGPVAELDPSADTGGGN